MSGKNAACWTPRPALPLRVPLACSLKEPEAFPFLSLCEGVAPFRRPAAPLRGPQSPQTYSRDWRAAGSRQRWPARPLWAPVAETRTAPTARLPHPRGGPTSGSSWTRLLCLLEERVSRRQAYGRGVSIPETERSFRGAGDIRAPRWLVCLALRHRPFFCHLPYPLGN